jgi:hypothetical protein
MHLPCLPQARHPLPRRAEPRRFTPRRRSGKPPGSGRRQQALIAPHGPVNGLRPCAPIRAELESRRGGRRPPTRRYDEELRVDQITSYLGSNASALRARPMASPVMVSSVPTAEVEAMTNSFLARGEPESANSRSK